MARFIEISYIAGTTPLTGKLSLGGVNAIAETVTFTERSNVPGRFLATVTVAADDYYITLFSGANNVGADTVTIGDTDGTVYPSGVLTAAATVTALAADIWAYATRTLTQPAASVVTAVTGSSITVYRGTKWSITLTGLGNISNYTKLYFTARANTKDTDVESLVKIQVTNPADAVNDGLLVFNGAVAADKSKGSIVVNDAVTGSVTMTVDASVTAGSAGGGLFIYDIKKISASSVDLVSSGGEMNVLYDVTRAVT